MTGKIPVSIIQNGVDVLNAEFAAKLRLLIADLDAAFKSGTIKTNFQVYETYRSPQRQAWLFEQKPPVTKSRISAHEFGLATDFAAMSIINGHRSWSWSDDHPWGVLKMMAEHRGLEIPIKWDRGHVQDPRWQKISHVLGDAAKYLPA